jgi:hypothetical protein
LAEAAATNPQARADFLSALGPAANYTLLSETGVPQVQANGTTITGNVGIANPTGSLSLTATGHVVGKVDFAGTANVDVPANVTGTITSNVNLTPATTAYVNLSTNSNSIATAAPVAPTVNLTSGATIDITTGKLVGNTYYFNIGSVNLSGGPVFISGALAPAGSNVVFNTNSNLNLNGPVIDTGGLTSDSVLFNVAGSGHSLQTATNGGAIQGILLDPNGTISIDHTSVLGRVYGGGTNNLSIVSGSSLTSVPEPSTFAAACFVVVIGLGYSWQRRRRARLNAPHEPRAPTAAAISREEPGREEGQV